MRGAAAAHCSDTPLTKSTHTGVRAGAAWRASPRVAVVFVDLSYASSNRAIKCFSNFFSFVLFSSIPLLVSRTLLVAVRVCVCRVARCWPHGVCSPPSLPAVLCTLRAVQRALLQSIPLHSPPPSSRAVPLQGRLCFPPPITTGCGGPWPLHYIKTLVLLFLFYFYRSVSFLAHALCVRAPLSPMPWRCTAVPSCVHAVVAIDEETAKHEDAIERQRAACLLCKCGRLHSCLFCLCMCVCVDARVLAAGPCSCGCVCCPLCLWCDDGRRRRSRAAVRGAPAVCVFLLPAEPVAHCPLSLSVSFSRSLLPSACIPPIFLSFAVSCLSRCAV